MEYRRRRLFFDHQATAAQVEGVQPSLEGMGKALEQAAAALPGDAGVVLAALNDVVALKLAPAATEVVSRSENVITSTAQALNFYQQGDLTMLRLLNGALAR